MGAVSARFGRDEHSTLATQLFLISQIGSVSDYIEQFDTLVHQLLAYDPYLSSVVLTAKFIDGLKDEIQSVVVIQRPKDLDTASSLALLQEGMLSRQPRKEFKKVESYSYKLLGRSQPLPLPAPPVVKAYVTPEEKKPPDAARSRGWDDKASALIAYRRSKGLCYKCGDKWSHTHKCSGSVALHMVEEMWALMTEPEEDPEFAQFLKLYCQGSDEGEQLYSISR